MWATSSHAATTAPGRPSRSAPTTSVAGAGLEPAQRHARAGHEGDPPAGQLGRVAHPRQRHGEERAHRGAYGLRPVRVGAAGPERDRRRAERERRAQHPAHVAGVADAPQREAQRAGRRRGPALRVDRERPGARPELRDAPRAAAPPPRRPRAPSPPRRSARRGAQPAASAAASRSSPSATNAPSFSRQRRPASLRTSTSCGLWGLVIATEPPVSRVAARVALSRRAAARGRAHRCAGRPGG